MSHFRQFGNSTGETALKSVWPAVILLVFAAVSVPVAADDVVADVRAAIAAGDLNRADAEVSERRAAQGITSEIIEAVSLLGSGSLTAGDLERASSYARDARRLAESSLGGRRVDSDAHLAAALGTSIEVEAQATARSGDRSGALYFLQHELETYKNTAIHKKIQKNINLLTLEGHPAPPLDISESIGPSPSSLDRLRGRVVVLFFWAHWCPDCKIEGPILAKVFAKYRKQGLAVVAPTQRYGYVESGTSASPDEELRHIVAVRDKYYGFLVDVPVPLSEANPRIYGVSSTPTLVIVDRQGIVRLYHPGRMTESELGNAIRPLVSARTSAGH